MTESTISNHGGGAAPLRYFHKPWISDLMNESVTKLFIEQPRLHRVCKKGYTFLDEFVTNVLKYTKSDSRLGEANDTESQEDPLQCA